MICKFCQNDISVSAVTNKRYIIKIDGVVHCVLLYSCVYENIMHMLLYTGRISVIGSYICLK